jgi:hypothetical protein
MNQDKINQIMNSNNPYAKATDFSPIVRIYNKIPRNEKCPYTNLKFKRCCGKTGQDFCEKAKEALKQKLDNLILEKNNEEKK